MRTFPYDDGFTAGCETRKLARYARELLVEAETNLKIIPINQEARMALRDRAILDRRLAIGKLREARQIMRTMIEQPGFKDGWRSAA